MTHDLQRSEVAFLDFQGSGSAARSAPATIAVFPRPASRGRLRADSVLPRDDSENLLGESPEMVDVAARLNRIAGSQVSVMLVGESGTGKEVAAGLLHSRSARAGGPFVAVNCGAIPASLVEAELFGYERGAFTGAARQHQGYFERASGGTLFLDEITEMPIELQPKLLRVLETGRLVRVGGSEEIRRGRPRRGRLEPRPGNVRARPPVARGPLFSPGRVRAAPAAAAAKGAGHRIAGAGVSRPDESRVRDAQAFCRRSACTGARAFMAGQRARIEELHRAQLRAVRRCGHARPASRRLRTRSPARTRANASVSRSARRWPKPSARYCSQRCATAEAVAG